MTARIYKHIKDEPLKEQLQRIKEYDRRLAVQLRSTPWLAEPFAGKRTEQTLFFEEVHKLVNDITEIADATFDIDLAAYYWLEDAAARWTFICQTSASASVALKDFCEKSTVVSLNNWAINRFVQFESRRISELRRHAQAIWLELQKTIQETTHAEDSYDWIQAETYFAKDMLYGNGDLYQYIKLGDVKSSELWKYLHHDTFDRLQNIWLSDVFQLRAYEIWLERGAPAASNQATMDGDYQNACFHFMHHMLNDAIKYPEDSRVTLAGYIRDKMHLSKEMISEDREPFSTLIDKKARRIEQLGRHGNRSRAAKFVMAFYRNLYGAAVADDDQAKKELAIAFNLGRGADGGCPIASCFEALVMVYYIRGAIEGSAHPT